MLRSIICQLLVLLLGLLLCSEAAIALPVSPPDTPVTDVYQERARHNPDGIGKFYMNREIAQVMGHQGAGWLERPSRQVEEQPDRAIAALDLQPTDVVADIGAGTGYFSFRISQRVPEGKVFAVDLQPEMIEILNFLKQEASISNVEPILGSIDNPNLPLESVDLALMVDAYHEFEYPKEMMTELFKALKPGGQVVLLEYRAENPLILIKGLHKMSQRQVKKEMGAIGLVWQETKGFLPQQHFMVFRKPIAASA
ncbi:class I SAM-dependent methyltransferase [Phormidium tenue FACHB-886]|nr:class I SAM-dependent methyltransferase [Phormidium tenue FACHB-886]